MSKKEKVKAGVYTPHKYFSSMNSLLSMLPNTLAAPLKVIGVAGMLFSAGFGANTYISNTVNSKQDVILSKISSVSANVDKMSTNVALMEYRMVQVENQGKVLNDTILSMSTRRLTTR